MLNICFTIKFLPFIMLQTWFTLEKKIWLTKKYGVFWDNRERSEIMETLCESSGKLPVRKQNRPKSEVQEICTQRASLFQKPCQVTNHMLLTKKFSTFRQAENCFKLHSRLTSKEERHIFCRKDWKSIPYSWKNYETANYDYLRGFLHGQLPLYLPLSPSASIFLSYREDKSKIVAKFKGLNEINQDIL
jgi:hypothetical protein